MDSKKVVKEFWASYGRGNLDETWEAYVADDIVVHAPPGRELDRESWLADEKAFCAAFGDIDVKVLDQVAEGDLVASRWSFSGRQTAEFMGVSSRGGTATLTGILFDRIREDKIVEHWAEVGLSRFLRALRGALPPRASSDVYSKESQMTRMKAVVVDRYGGPFRVAELPIPETAPGQILVRVEAAGLNPMDWKFADGAFREVVPAVFPMVIGSDAAGEVAAVGESVSRFGIGDKVFGQFLGHPIGSTGTFAEFVAIDENASVGPSPRKVDATGAAALPTAAGAAFDLIEAVAPLQGKTVLVVGAGGGVGSYTVQLAVAAGAVVLGTSRPIARERLLSYGAVDVIDHSAVSVAEAVRARYVDGVDVLLDMTEGVDAFSEHLTAVRRGGLAASLTRAATGANAGVLGVRAIDIALQMGPDLLARIASSIDNGEIVLPPIERVDLDTAPQVLEDASAGHADGKTVVIPSTCGPSTESENSERRARRRGRSRRSRADLC